MIVTLLGNYPTSIYFEIGEWLSESDLVPYIDWYWCYPFINSIYFANDSDALAFILKFRL